jgi:hypothetical protein
MSFALPLRVIRIDPAAFSAGRPVATSQAWNTMRNLRHITAQSPQTYINFAGMKSRYESSLAVIVTTTPVTVPLAFKHIWTRPDRPTNFKLIASGRTSSFATTSVRFRLVPDVGPTGYAALPVMIDATAVISSPTPVEIFNTFTLFGPFPAARCCWRNYSFLENGAAVNVPVAKMRLEVTFQSDADDVENVVEVCSLALWGYE